MSHQYGTRTATHNPLFPVVDARIIAGEDALASVATDPARVTARFGR